MTMYRVVALAGVFICASAPITAQPKADRATLKLTNSICSEDGKPLALDAKASTFLLDVSALKLQKRPMELLIMRKPEMSFFRVPWVAGRIAYEVSPATAKPIFSQYTLFPLRQGEKLTISLMSPSDEVIVLCAVQVR